MAYTYEELHHKTVAELRDIASGIEDESLKGYTAFHKEQLLPLLCKALKIEVHAHHEALGIDKTALKRQIRGCQADRDAALSAGDYEKLRDARRRIHRLKRRIRKAMV